MMYKIIKHMVLFWASPESLIEDNSGTKPSTVPIQLSQLDLVNN